MASRKDREGPRHIGERIVTDGCRAGSGQNTGVHPGQLVAVARHHHGRVGDACATDGDGRIGQHGFGLGTHKTGDLVAVVAHRCARGSGRVGLRHELGIVLHTDLQRRRHYVGQRRYRGQTAQGVVSQRLRSATEGDTAQGHGFAVTHVGRVELRRAGLSREHIARKQAGDRNGPPSTRGCVIDLIGGRGRDLRACHTVAKAQGIGRHGQAARGLGKVVIGQPRVRPC